MFRGASSVRMDSQASPWYESLVCYGSAKDESVRLHYA